MMRNSNLIAWAGLAVSAIFGIGFANAADLPARTDIEPAAAHNWSGCYLGGYVGRATQSREVNAWDPASTGGKIPAGTFYDPSGTHLPPNPFDIGEFNYDLGASVIGGGTLGCNWQGAYPFVFGIEGESGYMKVAATALSPYSIRANTNDTFASTRIGDWYASGSGRFGYAWDRVLVYLKAGVGFANINSSVIDTCSAAPCSPRLLTATGSSHQPFWVAGIGVEYAVTNNWSVKGEFLNLGMYKRFEVCGPGGGTVAGSTFCGMHGIEGVRSYKAGVNYRFDAPILARY